MGWLFIAFGVVMALGGALRALYIGGKALGENPDPSSPERNAPRYVKPALRAAVVSMAGMALILVGVVVLIAGMVAAAIG